MTGKFRDHESHLRSKLDAPVAGFCRFVILVLVATLLACISANAQTKVRVFGTDKTSDTSFTLMYEMYIPVPAQFVSLPQKDETLQSFKRSFPEIERLDGDMVVFRITDSFTASQTEAAIQQYLQTKYLIYQAGINAIQINAGDWLTGQTFDGTTWHCNE